MIEHTVEKQTPDRLSRFIGLERAVALDQGLRVLARTLGGRRLVNVTGNDQRKGGVYEVVRATLPYLRNAGIDVIWPNLITRPEDRPALEFFHVLAHGRAPSATWKDDLDERTEEFGRFASHNAEALQALLRADDVLVLHDTQTALLVGTHVLAPWRPAIIWHAHIGTTQWNRLAHSYWNVVGSSVSRARARVFCRREFAPPSLRLSSVYVRPGIDPASEKSAEISGTAARKTVADGSSALPLAWHGDAPLLRATDVVALQLSRWDYLKDMPGAVRVLGTVAASERCFRGLVVGPSAQSEAERAQLEAAQATLASLDPAARERVHVGVIDRAGSAEHDRAVRALQSSADIVLQKSLEEGFGLTVTEAMLRGKAVVAAAVGGIPLQLANQHNGLLVAGNEGDIGWERAVRTLVHDRQLRSRLGAQARADVLEHHTVDRYLAALLAALHCVPR